MVSDASCTEALTIQVARGCRKIGVKSEQNVIVDQRGAMFGAEDDMNQIEAQRLRHGSDYMSGLQPSIHFVSVYLGLLTPRSQKRSLGTPVRPRLLCRRTFGPQCISARCHRLRHGSDYMSGLQPSIHFASVYLGLRPRLVCRRTFGPHCISTQNDRQRTVQAARQHIVQTLPRRIVQTVWRRVQTTRRCVVQTLSAEGATTYPQDNLEQKPPGPKVRQNNSLGRRPR